MMYWFKCFLMICVVCLSMVCCSRYSFGAVEIQLPVVKYIESSGNPLAYNVSSQATGLYQITPVCLKDFNQRNKTTFIMADMYNPTLNTRVARWYIYKRIPQMLNYYDVPVTVDTILWAYNAGIGRVVKGELPAETVEYIRKYKRGVK